MSNKDAIRRAWETHRRVSPDLTTAAVQSFMTSLGGSRLPSSEELQSALQAARRTLVDGLFADRDKINPLFSGDVPSSSRLDALRLQLNEFSPQINCPPLPVSAEIPVLRLALAATLGTVLGVMIGSPIGIYFLGTRDTGLVLGGPLGAFLTTWAAIQASRNKWVSNSLIAALGVATVAEAWTLLPTNPLAIWGRLSGSGTVKRIVTYLMLIALLIFTRPQVTYNRSILENAVRGVLEQWLYGTLVVVATLGEETSDVKSEGQLDQKTLGELGRRIIEMRSATMDGLPGLAEDVIETARAAGFEGLDGPTVFGGNRSEQPDQSLKWDESMRERFNPFGHIEPGDGVRIDREPVIRNGEVLEKGLVRKKRGG